MITFCNVINAFATSTPSPQPPPPPKSQKVIPITVLSGFLGSGKTTLLQHLLNNNQGLRIAVIVNDVAEVNIDQKLIAGQTVASSEGEGVTKNTCPAGIVQLANGCACCSLSEELLLSVSELVTLSDTRKPFDHIVIELSGISSASAVRANFQDAASYGMPLLDRVRLDTMVTVIDCTTFLNYLEDKDGRLVNAMDAPDLFYRKDGISEDDVSYNAIDPNGDIPADVLDYIMQGLEGGIVEPEQESTIAQLLVEQTEIADIVLLNKIDMMDESDASTINRIEDIVSKLNSNAKRFPTKFGVVEKLQDVLGAAKGQGVVGAGIVDDHRDSVRAADGGVITLTIQ